MAEKSEWEIKRDERVKRYNELMQKYRIAKGPVTNTNNFDVIVSWVGAGCGNAKYMVEKNTPGLSNDDLALICDGGNLCFGYRTEDRCIVVYTD